MKSHYNMNNHTNKAEIIKEVTFPLISKCPPYQPLNNYAT